MQRTPLYETHVRLGARMVEFGGWEMPVQYTSILEEHLAVRRAAALFDLCHMGRLSVRGPGALRALECVCTVRVQSVAPHRIKYSILCREDGGVLDDILVYNHGNEYSLVVNAGNRQRDFDWIQASCREHGATLVDRSEEISMIAVQGARSVEVLSPISDVDLDSLPYYAFTHGRVAGEAMRVSRTGYTGDDGFELYPDSRAVVRVWDRILETGRAHGLVPAGLGARDSLRTEAAMPLYGHETTLETNPFEVGFSWAVDLDKDFIGRDALRRLKAAGVKRRLVGFVALGKRIPRQGSPVLAGARQVGAVTSGTRTPLTDRTIGMALVEIAASAVGRELEVDVRGHREPIRVEKLPFYSCHRKPGAAKDEAAAQSAAR